jgi:hypothetical protein
MGKSHVSFMTNGTIWDHMIFLLMVFAGVFCSSYFWQESLEWSFLDATFSTIAFGLGAFLIKLMLTYYPVGKIKSWPTILFALIIASALTFVIPLAREAGLWLNADFLSFYQLTIPLRVAAGTMIFYLLGLIVFSDKSNSKDFEVLEQAEIRQKLSNDAELHYLRQQMQPHFLFNSLNSINALLVKNPEKAREMVQGLADFYRENLRMDAKKWVEIEKEVKVIGQYLLLEKIRFGHRLKVEINLPDHVSTFKLPSLMVQTLVENAVKHGLYGVMGDVLISIDARKKGIPTIHQVQALGWEVSIEDYFFFLEERIYLLTRQVMVCLPPP